MLYATEVMPLSKHLLNTLDSGVNQTVAKIFNICDKDSIDEIIVMCDLPDVSVMVEHCRMKFMNNMLYSEHFRCIGLICINY